MENCGNQMTKQEIKNMNLEEAQKELQGGYLF
jgi:hypothetical protein